MGLDWVRKALLYLPRRSFSTCLTHFVGNKPKGRISKRVIQENKARQIFRKTNISYPLKNLACFVFLKHPFWNSPICLITDDLGRSNIAFSVKCAIANLFQFLVLLPPDFHFKLFVKIPIFAIFQVVRHFVKHFVLSVSGDNNSLEFHFLWREALPNRWKRVEMICEGMRI